MNRRRPRALARAALVWALGCFAGLQLALTGLLERGSPRWRDPEYGVRLAGLRARLAESPDRPLVLVLGSSRAATGLRPDVLRDGPLVYNFGLTGAGPLRQLLCLHRLLAAGIRPAEVWVEILPPLLNQDGPWAEVNRIEPGRLDWEDCRLVGEFSGRPGMHALTWCLARLAPWLDRRFFLLDDLAPAWLPWDSRQNHVWRRIDAHGWLPYPRTEASRQEYRRGLDRARREYRHLLRPFRVSPVSDRALRRLLAVCRANGIAATLFLMPESSDFRRWYPRPAEARLDRFLAVLGREFGVRRVDARTWITDADFADGHHLLPRGATRFSKRFGRVVQTSPSAIN